MKPMLAVHCEDINTLTYPVLVSPKLDGIRGLCIQGKLLSRSLKPIPNRALAVHFDSVLLSGLDGELLSGKPTEDVVYRQTVSNVMSGHTDASTIHLWVFDDFTDPSLPFSARLQLAEKRVKELQSFGVRVVMVPHYYVNSPEELTEAEEYFLSQGYEGAMVRSPLGPYKFGRSTLREGYLLKVKRFLDSEAKVIGVEELYHNDNEQTTNELGNSHRSSEKAGLRAGGILGALNVVDIKSGVEFNIGSGFTQEEREQLWRSPPIGQIARYKYFPKGSKDKPRHPTFTGWRDARDL